MKTIFPILKKEKKNYYECVIYSYVRLPCLLKFVYLVNEFLEVFDVSKLLILYL